MGIFDFFRGPGGGYAQWSEPAPLPSHEEWQRNLAKYAAKSAKVLGDRQVPLWKSARTRNGHGTYRDQFWVLSVDVNRANRLFVEFDLNGGRGIKKGDFGGHIQGDALLLTKLGAICSSKVEMFFPPSGNHAEGNLDSTFGAPGHEHLKESPWADANTGRWRSRPNAKARGVVVATRQSEFTSSYPAGAWDRSPGMGSSSALTSFVKTGQTRWPRYFSEFYGR